MKLHPGEKFTFRAGTLNATIYLRNPGMREPEIWGKVGTFQCYLGDQSVSLEAAKDSLLHYYRAELRHMLECVEDEINEAIREVQGNNDAIELLKSEA
jgi:hypothetical protein